MHMILVVLSSRRIWFWKLGFPIWGFELFVLFIVMFVVCFGGAYRLLVFEKLHAQFAYYKSPEQGLNLSGS